MTAEAVRPVVLVTDGTTKAELGETLGHICHLAKRCVPCVGTEDQPTPWDLRHRSIDALLDDWLKAEA